VKIKKREAVGTGGDKRPDYLPSFMLTENTRHEWTSFFQVAETNLLCAGSPRIYMSQHSSSYSFRHLNVHTDRRTRNMGSKC